MWSFFTIIYFMIMLSLGLFVMISSNSWLGVWAGFELNLLGFTPVLFMGSKTAGEVSVKYFLVQVSGSFLLLMGGLNSLNSMFFCLFIMIALMLKLGVAPLHFWYPLLVEELEWMQFYLLSTFQKIGPLIVLSYISFFCPKLLFYLCVTLSVLVGANSGLMEVSLRKLLAFSSVSHLGWLLLPLMESSSVWIFYFFIYSLLLACVVFSLNLSGMYHLNQMLNIIGLKSVKMCAMISLLSLSGLPPLLGFLPKWLVLQLISSQVPLSLFMFMVFTSVLMLFYYIRLFISMMFLLFKKPSNFSIWKSDTIIIIILMINLFGLSMSNLLVFSFLQ